jgi:Holliday junction resolvase RusA-like endonuclease
MGLELVVDIPGKPRAKTRPRMVRGRIWTPSTKDEEAVATQLLVHQGMFKGETRLSFFCGFYGADPRTDGDNLFKLVVDAAVRAGVIDNDRFVLHGGFEKFPVEHVSNPCPGQPATQITVRTYE